MPSKHGGRRRPRPPAPRSPRGAGLGKSRQPGQHPGQRLARPVLQQAGGLGPGPPIPGACQKPAQVGGTTPHQRTPGTPSSTAQGCPEWRACSRPLLAPRDPRPRLLTRPAPPGCGRRHRHSLQSPRRGKACREKVRVRTQVSGLLPRDSHRSQCCRRSSRSGAEEEPLGVGGHPL